MAGKRRILKLAIAFVGGSLVALGIAGFFLLKPWIKQQAIDKAADHGIVLSIGEFSFSWSRVVLHDPSFELAGLPRIHGTAKELEVSLVSFKLAGIRADDVRVEVEGTAPAVVLGVSEWTKRYPNIYRLPASATNVRVTWREQKGGAPYVELFGGTIGHGKTSTAFRAEHTQLHVCPNPKEGAPPGQQCPDLGEFGAAWTADDAVVELGLGTQDLEHAPVKLAVKHAVDPPTADIVLAETKVEELAGPFAVSIPELKGVRASGVLHLELPKGRKTGPIAGTLSAKLLGFVPPHPKEIDGFVFGDMTTLDTKLVIAENKERLDLTETKVTAGAFKLAGNGSVVKEEDHGRIKVELKGNLPCSALAGAMADSYLGKIVGGLAGQLARQLVGGSVGITVRVDADTRKLPDAKIDKLVGVGCGLKPLKIGDIDFSKLPDLGKLPPIPSGMIPNFELPPPPSEAPKPKPEPKPATSI
jgi:ADP-dependent NAD(P)H-hydrate dehydratase / NAD(P)H-hydrate epimerase